MQRWLQLMVRSGSTTVRAVSEKFVNLGVGGKEGEILKTVYLAP